MCAFQYLLDGLKCLSGIVVDCNDKRFQFSTIIYLYACNMTFEFLTWFAKSSFTNSLPELWLKRAWSLSLTNFPSFNVLRRLSIFIILSRCWFLILLVIIFQSELCSIFSKTEYFFQQDKLLPVQQTWLPQVWRKCYSLQM